TLTNGPVARSETQQSARSFPTRRGDAEFVLMHFPPLAVLQDSSFAQKGFQPFAAFRRDGFLHPNSRSTFSYLPRLTRVNMAERWRPFRIHCGRISVVLI